MMVTFFRRYRPTIFVGFILFILFSLPEAAIDPLRPEKGWLKILFSNFLAHTAGMGLFTLTLGLNLARLNDRFPLIRTTVLAFAYAFFIELWQGLIPWRSFELQDFIPDIAGIFLSSLFLLVEQKISLSANKKA